MLSQQNARGATTNGNETKHDPWTLFTLHEICYSIMRANANFPKNIQIFKALSNKKCQHTQNIEAHKVVYANLFKAISIFISLFAVAVVGRMASNELCSPNLANRNRKFAYSVFWNGSA